jgi:hypothetical protein
VGLPLPLTGITRCQGGNESMRGQCPVPARVRRRVHRQAPPDLGRRAGVRGGALRAHLRRLVDGNRLVVRRDGRYSCYFPGRANNERRRAICPALAGRPPSAASIGGRLGRPTRHRRPHRIVSRHRLPPPQTPAPSRLGANLVMRHFPGWRVQWASRQLYAQSFVRFLQHDAGYPTPHRAVHQFPLQHGCPLGIRWHVRAR